MTLTGGPVQTVQLLVAISASGPLRTVDERNGADADAFFNDLTEELAGRGAEIDLAVTSFEAQARPAPTRPA